MLRVSLVGNMGAEPEARFTNKGTQMTTFNVAVNQIRNGADGERQENTHWFRVRVMGARQEYVSKLTKGARVLVVGRLDIGQYKSREGDMRTSLDVWADEVVAMSQRPPADTGGFDAEPEAEAEPVAAPQARNGKPKRSEELEDLPF
jgi:single-strand DNA-binding protein